MIQDSTWVILYVFNSALMINTWGDTERNMALQLSRSVLYWQDTQGVKGKEILCIHFERYFWDKSCGSLRSLPGSSPFSCFVSFHLLCCLMLHMACANLCLLMLSFIYCITVWFQRKPGYFFYSFTSCNQWMQLAYCFPSVSVIYID